MAATSLQQPACIAQQCNNNLMLFMEQEWWWSGINGAHSHIHKRGLPGHMFRTCRFVTCSCPPAKLALWEGGGSSSAVLSQRQRQEELWREYFRDPKSWWDCRQERKSSRFPDFRHKESDALLWLNSFHKPAWVDVQLTMLDTQSKGITPPTSNSTLPHDSDPPPVPNWQGNVTAQTVSKMCEKGQVHEAVDALDILVDTESRVSTSLLYSVLKLCMAQKNLVLGRRVHDVALKIGYGSNTFLGNHILRMYASHGRLQEAMEVFTRVAAPNAFTWFSIISAYTKHGKPQQAIQLYHKMRSSGVKPDAHAFAAALQACASALDLESGRQVHDDVLESGVSPDLFVCNCLVDMYAKCGKLEDARRLFDSLATRDVVTWTAMISGYAKSGLLEDARRLFDSLDTRDVLTWTVIIAGYAEHGLGQEALALYGNMLNEGLVLADGFVFASLVKACGSAGALQQGKQLHSQIRERGLLEGDILLGSCLVDMYAKCGKLEDARTVFDSLKRKDVVTWNIMIDGYGQNNEGQKAIDCFQDMLLSGVQPDGTTFTCLLVACSHEGLVNEGRQYFVSMVERHGVMPNIKHSTCMVDLLGRAGLLDEAESMIQSCESNDVAFMSLLNACRSYGDIERGTRCFESLVRIDPQKAGAYVQMANTYSDAGRWTDVDRIETLRRLAGAKKKPATAGIEVDKQVHKFIVGEERDDISCKVRSMNVRLQHEGGHVPHTELVLKAVCEKQKEDELCGHAEKLALAYGLLNTADGTPLLVTKNLRMCRDCHSSTEIMSRIESREIVVRDAHRVHRFVGGSCSCGGRP